MPATVRELRILIATSIVLVCVMAGSEAPAGALMLAWTPDVLFLIAFTKGVLRFPHFLEPVKPFEPVLYRWLGIGLVKRIVATQMWPLLHGAVPPEKLKNDAESLDRYEFTMKCAEVCHDATFLLMFPVALYYLVAGRTTWVCWILGINLVLNGYPVMLQRANRLRLQKIRVRSQGEQRNSQCDGEGDRTIE